MDIMNFFYEQIGTQGIWFALFLYLFVKQDKKNTSREEKLEAQLNKSSEQLDECIEALKDLKSVKDTVEKIEDKIGK